MQFDMIRFGLSLSMSCYKGYVLQLWRKFALGTNEVCLSCRLEKQGSLQSNASGKSGLIKSFLPSIARSFSGMRGFKTASLR